jgi:hypothetical protein
VLDLWGELSGVFLPNQPVQVGSEVIGTGRRPVSLSSTAALATRPTLDALACSTCQANLPAFSSRIKRAHVRSDVIGRVVVWSLSRARLRSRCSRSSMPSHARPVRRALRCFPPESNQAHQERRDRTGRRLDSLSSTAALATRPTLDALACSACEANLAAFSSRIKPAHVRSSEVLGRVVRSRSRARLLSLRFVRARDRQSPDTDGCRNAGAIRVRALSRRNRTSRVATVRVVLTL